MTAIFTHIQSNGRAAFSHSAVANVHGEETGPTSMTLTRAQVFNAIEGANMVGKQADSSILWDTQLKRAQDAYT
jgi:hypothetical protein